VKKARAMQLLRRASSLRLKAMMQTGNDGERKHSASFRVPGLALTHHPGMTGSVVHSSRDDAEAHAGESSGWPFSTI